MSQQPILGIMLLDTQFPRIPGDVGHPASYPFPTRMVTISGATVQRVIYEADPTVLALLVDGARQLEAEGVCAITSSCGFLSPFQERVSRAVEVPVFLSSLIQVPLVYTLTQNRVAILTASKTDLNPHVLTSAGIPDSIPLAIAGLQDTPAFRDPILNNRTTLNKTEIQKSVVEIATGLLSEYPDIASFVLECHNLAPYGNAVSSATGKPVFDIISFSQWIYASVVKRTFPDP
jgi:hypothetical protein